MTGRWDPDADQLYPDRARPGWPLRVRVAAVLLLPAWAHRRVIRLVLGGLVLAAMVAAVLIPGRGAYGCERIRPDLGSPSRLSCQPLPPPRVRR